MSNHQEQPTATPSSATKPKGREAQTYLELQREMSQYLWRKRYDRASGGWRKVRLGPDGQDVVVPGRKVRDER